MPPSSAPRPPRLLLALVAAASVGLAWTASSPALLAQINWDNAGYIAGIGNGTLGWSSPPWNNHFAVGHLYLLGVWLMRPLGGTVIDGFRLVNALFAGAATATVAWLAFRLAGSRLLAGLLALAWTTAWVNLHYHLILEDNFLFLAPAAGVVGVAVVRLDDWSPRDSLATGALCAVGALGSWQAVPYFALAIYAALIGGGERGALRRGRDALLVLASGAGTLLAWAALVAATSTLSLSQLVASLFAPPTTSYLPRSGAALLRRLLDLDGHLATLGTGILYHLQHTAYALRPGAPSPRLVGLLGALALTLLLVGCTIWSWRRRRFVPHLLAASLALFSLVTCIHRDPATYTALKRFDFAPLLLVALAAFAVGRLRLTTAADGRRWERPAAALLALVVAAQTAYGLDWSRRRRREFVTVAPWGQIPHPPAMYYGREGSSFAGYFRALGQERRACRYFFSLAELYEGRWNLDLPASIWSELPTHVALTEPRRLPRWDVRRWRFPVRVQTPTEARARKLIEPCAWLSEDAERVLAGRPPPAPPPAAVRPPLPSVAPRPPASPPGVAGPSPGDDDE